MKQLRENKLILLLNWCYYSITKFSKYYIKFFLDLRLSFLIIRNYYVTILTIEIHGYQKKKLILIPIFLKIRKYFLKDNQRLHIQA